MRGRNTRAMAISFFVIVISAFNFERLTGSNCIRAIHIVTLLVCGIGIGIFLMNLFDFLAKKRNQRQN